MTTLVATDRWVLGIDTSAYTTSLALVDGTGQLVADERTVLTVPAGRRGLRQSDAVFQHVRHLPKLFGRFPERWGDRLAAIGVSVTPRPIAGSYMPVFVAGRAAAAQLGLALGVPVLELSHQEGHLWAGLWSLRDESIPRSPFLALHVSGGTTELLHVAPLSGGRLDVRLLGGTEDLSAGQMIDRVGVALGLPFPAGASLEQLARETHGGASGDAVSLPVSRREGEISFSGPTTAALRALENGVPPAALARGVQHCVRDSLIGLVEWGRTQYNSSLLLAVGGVMANEVIRSGLAAACSRWGMSCRFARPKYSVDNAVGCAVAAFVHSKPPPLIRWV